MTPPCRPLPALDISQPSSQNLQAFLEHLSSVGCQTQQGKDVGPVGKQREPGQNIGMLTCKTQRDITYTCRVVSYSKSTRDRWG